MRKENIYMFLVVILLLSIVSGILFNREGFYSNNSTSSAKASINDLLSNQLTTATTTLNDMSSNKYNLDITSVISNLNEEMKNSSNVTRNFIKTKKDELSSIQKNMNRINEQFTKFSTGTTVEQLISPSDPNSLKKIPIIDAIDRINSALRRISNELSEIPE
jgi:hypothetical protein